MRKLIYPLLFGAALMLTLFPACKKYSPQCDGSSPTYNADVKSIINAKCTSSGCHPSISSYNGLRTYLNNGSFSKEVLENQSMPKGSSLSNGELDLLQCWHDNGYPES
jgi:hypothetical protein